MFANVPNGVDVGLPWNNKHRVLTLDSAWGHSQGQCLSESVVQLKDSTYVITNACFFFGPHDDVHDVCLSCRYFFLSHCHYDRFVFMYRTPCYTNGHPATQMDTLLYKWTPCYTNGHPPIQMDTLLYKSTPCYTNGHPATQMDTLLHKWTPCYTNGHPATQMDTLLHKWTPCYTNAPILRK